jgi:Zn-dependent protease
MTPYNGSIRLFRAAGVDVYLHWAWLLGAYYFIQGGMDPKTSLEWSVARCLTLFGIVLLHEFGHALACRSVGGRADRIVLWPLGGVAYVNPPPRPGAVLWSIAAGPLVNVALLPVTVGLVLAAAAAGWGETVPAFRFLVSVAYINAGLLIFNLLPVYPLDGGQILQALLWFVIGRERSLRVVSVIGMAAGAAFVGLALYWQDVWLLIICLFVVMQAWVGFRRARLLGELSRMPRHAGAACPSCGEPPLAGPFWRCGRCNATFDTFDTRGTCPGCGASFPTTTCPNCGTAHPIAAWSRTAAPVSKLYDSYGHPAGS